MAYKARHETDAVVRLADNAIIGPENEADWAEYQAWVVEGNMPEPADALVRPTLADISDRQFYQQAAIAGMITKEDALAAVRTGFIPAPLQAVVDTIAGADQKFLAEMLLSGATIYKREHPLTDAIGAAFSMTPDDVDAFFIEAAKL